MKWEIKTLCGIVGHIIDGGLSKDFDLQKITYSMLDELTSRGPDDQGIWIEKNERVCMGHRRLSIQDLSKAGYQPMESKNKNLIMVFNGEIYNHISLRKELEKNEDFTCWDGHSDSETLLAGIQSWGFENCLKKINGMFAIAVFDKKNSKLLLARDRLGEKPLFYGINNNCFYFGSELKAFAKHPYWKPKLDRNSLASYLRFSYVPNPYSIYRGIFKLIPGHWIEIDTKNIKLNKTECFWDLKTIAENNSARRYQKNKDTLILNLEKDLIEAINIRTISDVPVGAFLSGGIDSTLIVSLLKKEISKDLKTYTIGFKDVGYNEAEDALKIANYLGTSHNEIYLSPKDALDVIPDLPRIWDEPFGDSSQIPTLLVSKLSKDSLGVVLSGDGGDELFCGYTRYSTGYKLYSSLKRMPKFMRINIANFLRNLPVDQMNNYVDKLPSKYKFPAFANRFEKLSNVLSCDDKYSYYLSLVSTFNNPSEFLIEGNEKNTILDLHHDWPNIDNFEEVMMTLDLITYLSGDILTKLDRASMSVSLEARVPFLDHNLIENSFKIPFKYKYRNGQNKWILKKILSKYIPSNLIQKPKKGFGIPIEYWLKNNLIDWAENLINEDRLNKEGLFNTNKIRLMWNDFLLGKNKSHHQLWNILMFQAWLDKWNVEGLLE